MIAIASPARIGRSEEQANCRKATVLLRRAVPLREAEEN